MKNVTVIDHPLVQSRLSRLRDASTPHGEFRRLLRELSVPLVYEAARDLPTRSRRVKTPLAATGGVTLAREVLLVPILRAALGMLSGLDELLPDARVGYIGLARNEKTLEPEWYLDKVPRRLARYEVFLLDPMLATGGSALAAGEMLERRGARTIRFVHVLAAPEGLRTVRKRFPQSQIYTGAIDSHLDSNGYIVPGLGDAGDRCFGC
ncbi:MAG: uracil phosphoribosyltransferase [Verrucomicrobiales bacterium]|nr:uracil phosphoribosyltransferase [Verrucomicrobiales bacterium]